MKYIFSLVIIFNVGMVLSLFSGCSPPKSETELLREIKDKRSNEDELNLKHTYDYHRLPEGFKVEKRLGDGWTVISIGNNKYLYHYREMGYAATEVLAPYHD